MKVCIIGAGGFLGSALADACLFRGIKTQLISSRVFGGINTETGLLPTDFCIEPNTNVVYYLSQSPHYRNVPAFASHLLTVNCVSAVQAVNAAVRAGAKHFFYASTANVYAPTFEPLSEDSPVSKAGWYSLSKIMAEDALLLFSDKIKISIGRIFAIYGPGQVDKLIPMLVDSVRSNASIFADRNPLNETDVGGLRISPVYVDDAVEILLNLVTYDSPNIINIGGDAALSITEMATAIGLELGAKANVIISDKFRTSNLICDTRFLEKQTSIKFTNFSEGLRKTIRNAY